MPTSTTFSYTDAKALPAVNVTVYVPRHSSQVETQVVRLGNPVSFCLSLVKCFPSTISPTARSLQLYQRMMLLKELLHQQLLLKKLLHKKMFQQ